MVSTELKGGAFARLTPAQRECLELVAQHYVSSKEQAKLLGVSSHAVDDRLKKAMRHLGASSREEAARLYVALRASEHQSPGCRMTSPWMKVGRLLRA